MASTAILNPPATTNATRVSAGVLVGIPAPNSAIQSGPMTQLACRHAQITCIPEGEATFDNLSFLTCIALWFIIIDFKGPSLRDTKTDPVPEDSLLFGFRQALRAYFCRDTAAPAERELAQFARLEQILVLFIMMSIATATEPSIPHITRLFSMARPLIAEADSILRELWISAGNIPEAGQEVFRSHRKIVVTGKVNESWEKAMISVARVVEKDAVERTTGSDKRLRTEPTPGADPSGTTTPRGRIPKDHQWCWGCKAIVPKKTFKEKTSHKAHCKRSK